MANGGIAQLSSTSGCNWYGTANYGELVAEYTYFTGKIFNKEGAGTDFVNYSTDAVTINCSGINATPANLNVTYNHAGENVVVTFDVVGNSSVIYPIPGLNPLVPADFDLIVAKYDALKNASTPAEIKAAALEIGDDIITEYYYMDDINMVHLLTAGGNPLVKNKYWNQYLNNTSTSDKYPDFSVPRLIVPIGNYSTSTNPLTGGTVTNGWLAPVYGKDLYVTVTFIHNGEVTSLTQSVAIQAAPVVNITKELGFLTIQGAISNTATTTGDIIEVSPGTYNELVTIDKSIHLRGKTGETDNTFIMPSASLPVASDPLSNIITVTGTGVNAEISGFTVKGPGPTNCGSIGRGIFVLDGATANIHDNKILDIRDNAAPLSGCQTGIAIQVGRNALGTSGTATIANNIITGYQKGAIVVDNTGSSAIITGNTITGIRTTAITAQNGIQISRGATATISNNTVSGNSYNASSVWDWGACGILLYQSGAVALTGGNTLSDNDNNYYAYGGITGTLSLGAEIFGPSTAPVTKGYQILVDENINIDASLCTFEGISPASASLTQLFAIEDRIWHSGDDPAKTGFVKVKAGNVYVTRTETGAHIQYGIDAAIAGDVVHVQAGDYGTEIAANRTVLGAGPHQFGLFIDKNNLTVQGYTASNNLPATAAEAAVLFTTNATNTFGYSGTMVVGNNVTLSGLEFGDNLPENDKAIEVNGNGFAINACRIIADAAIYIGDYSYNENGTPGNFIDDISSIQSYSIINCHFAGITSTGGVYIANGAGWNGSNVSSVTGRSITGNVFDGMTTIGFAGLSPGIGWLLYPTGAATVTGNTFTNPDNGRYIQSWGVVQAEFPYASYWNDNTFPKKTMTTTDGNPAHVRGYDASANFLNLKRIGTVIQPRIDFAQNGDVILVGAGNYNEDVTINKSVSLIGASYNNTIVSGLIGGAGATMKVAATGVIIDGFSITRDGNNPTDWNNADLNSAGIAIQGLTVNAEIRNCSLFGNRTGIDINNSNGNNIHNNLIDNNHTGLIFRNQTDNTIFTNNFVTNNRTAGVLFLDASGGTNVPVQSAVNSTFNNNDISGNWYGDIVDRQAGGSLPTPGNNLKNFECNWYGTTLPVTSTMNSAEPGYATLIPVIYGGTAVAPGGQPNILGPASANFDYVSYLLDGTDDDSGLFGFQPVPLSCGGSPVIIVSAEPTHIHCGDASGSILLTFEGGTPNYTIDWGGTPVTVVDDSQYTITGLTAGTYTITVTDTYLSSATITAEVKNLPVKNTTQTTYYANLQDAYNAANPNDVVEICAGTYPLASPLSISKSITIQGQGMNNTIIEISSSWFTNPNGHAFEINAVATNVTIQDLHFKVVGKGQGNILQIYGDNRSIFNNKFSGDYEFPDTQVTRATVWSWGTNITFSNNIVESLRQPGYINGGSGTISNNTFNITKGWVIAETFTGTLNITGNTFGNNASHITISNGADVSNLTINGNDLSGALLTGGWAIDNRLNGSLNAECNWFGSNDYNQIPQKVNGNVDFVPYLLTNNLTSPNCNGQIPPVHNVTQDIYYTTIQGAINAAMAADVIVVAPGTYTENVDVTVGVNLKGANADVSCTGIRSAETVLAPLSGVPVTISANGVTINGFEITNPSGNFAITSEGKNDLSVIFNNINDIGTSASSGNTHAVVITSSYATSDNVVVSDNCFSNIKGGEALPATSNGSAAAVAVGWSNAGFDITNLKIERNTITTVDACILDWASANKGGKGAYGIIINTGATSGSGKAVSPIIQDNVISDLEGLWSHAIGLEGDTPGASVTGNAISNLTAHKNDLDATGIMVEDNDGASSVAINNNSFLSLDYGVKNVTGTLVDATCNWVGNNTVSVVAAKYSADVTYSPWLIDGTDTETNIGFQPAPDACGGMTDIYVNDAFTAGDTYTLAVGDDATGNGTQQHLMPLLLKL